MPMFGRHRDRSPAIVELQLTVNVLDCALLAVARMPSIGRRSEEALRDEEDRQKCHRVIRLRCDDAIATREDEQAPPFVHNEK